MEKEYLSE